MRRWREWGKKTVVGSPQFDGGEGGGGGAHIHILKLDKGRRRRFLSLSLLHSARLTRWQKNGKEQGFFGATLPFTQMGD